ncbi:hypothetical protein IW146_006414 [Coemansia sp. RSA 922]|nr:hypothetical protein IW146_006414 [Coemansia sp. RSA 922]
MHKTKPETARSTSSVGTGFQQSASLVSLPMLPRPSTGAMMMAAPLGVGGPAGNFKRPRVNSKAGAALGSLFRAKVHTKRNSNGGDSIASPGLGPQPEMDAWAVGIDYPSVMSPLFSDESLQQLLGSSPQLTAVSVATPIGTQSPMSPLSPASRRSKREIAASVLQTSAGPFRRLRQGAHSKTMSYPPANGEASLNVVVGGDEFVVVTPDMCPPASLVSSSVISGVSGSVRVRAQTQVIERRYADSTESLIPVSAPSLSASSSEVSLARRRPMMQLPAHVLDSARRASGSVSLEDQRRLSHVARLECLSPYTVNRLNNTAARATERRRRSSAGRRSRASSASWADGTLGHARTASDHSDFSAHGPTFWPPGESPLPSDDEDARVSGFPSSSSAHFDFCAQPMSPRHHVTRSADEIRLARDVHTLLDPSSLRGAAVLPLHVLARDAEGRLECVDELSDTPASPCFSDNPDFDGSTLTQNSDWLLMNASSSDGEHTVQPSVTRPRRLRKRRVLPKTMFHAKPGLLADEMMYAATQSSDTLLTNEEVVVEIEAPIAEPVVPVVHTVLFVPRVPLSIHLHMPGLGRLALHCAGDSWEAVHIPYFALQLSACIERMPGLVDLSLVNLGLTSVPPRIVRCRGLQRLNLSHNWIDKVPAFLARLPVLRHILMPDNPVRVVAADLVEMRHRLDSLHIGNSKRWALLSRSPKFTTPATPEARAQVLYSRIHHVAQRRMAQCIAAPRLSLTQRQHDAQVARATKLLAIYADALYSSLREPRSWGHSVALPRPTADLSHRWPGCA